MRTSAGEFYRRWGRENCVVSGNAHRAEYGLFRQMLSIKCVARGTEDYFLERRRIRVADDTWLVLNEGREYASLLEGPAEAYTFSIFFRPGLAREVAGSLRQSLDQALDDGTAVAERGGRVLRIVAATRWLRHARAAFHPAPGRRGRPRRAMARGAMPVPARAPAARAAAPAAIDSGRARRARARRGASNCCDAWNGPTTSCTRSCRSPISLRDDRRRRPPVAFPFPAPVPGGVRAHAGRAPARAAHAPRAGAARVHPQGVAEIAARVGMSRIALWRALRAPRVPVRGPGAAPTRAPRPRFSRISVVSPSLAHVQPVELHAPFLPARRRGLPQLAHAAVGQRRPGDAVARGRRSCRAAGRSPSMRIAPFSKRPARNSAPPLASIQVWCQRPSSRSKKLRLLPAPPPAPLQFSSSAQPPRMRSMWLWPASLPRSVTFQVTDPEIELMHRRRPRIRAAPVRRPAGAGA